METNVRIDLTGDNDRIDLTDDNDMIDLTGDNDDNEVIDLTANDIVSIDLTNDTIKETGDFIFVHLSDKLPAWNIQGKPVQIPYNTKKEAFQQLWGLQQRGACELVAKYWNPRSNEWNVMTARNKPRQLHAEETLCIEYYKKYGVAGQPVMVWIQSMIIGLEPCHQKRYRGHQCIDLFKAKFKDIGFKTKTGSQTVSAQILPGKLETYVFFCQEQAPPGAMDKEWRDLRLMNSRDFREFLVNRMGIRPGTEFFELGRLDPMQVIQSEGKANDHVVDNNKVGKPY